MKAIDILVLNIAVLVAVLLVGCYDGHPGTPAARIQEADACTISATQSDGNRLRAESGADKWAAKKSVLGVIRPGDSNCQAAYEEAVEEGLSPKAQAASDFRVAHAILTGGAR